MIIVKDEVDELLKADASLHRDQHIDDAGFTLRVINYLPAGSRATRKIRLAIPLAFTLLAVTYVMFFTGASNLPIDVAMDIATNSLSTSAGAVLAIVGAMVGVSISATSES